MRSVRATTAWRRIPTSSRRGRCRGCRRRSATRTSDGERSTRTPPRESNPAESLLLRSTRNAIYTFDYFVPAAYVFGTGAGAAASSRGVGPAPTVAQPPILREPLISSEQVTSSEEPDLVSGPHLTASKAPIPAYDASYPCAWLYEGWERKVCPTWNVSTPTERLRFDDAWHEHNLRSFATPLRRAHDVPLFINQFAVVHGVSASAGRYEYIRGVLRLAKLLDIGWAWWTWAGGSGDGWAHGSSEVVFRWPNGSTMVDTRVLDAMQPFFGEG